MPASRERAAPNRVRLHIRRPSRRKDMILCQMFCRSLSKRDMATWEIDWAWSLPLIVLTVVTQVLGLGVIAEWIVGRMSNKVKPRHLTPLFVVLRTANITHKSLVMIFRQKTNYRLCLITISATAIQAFTRSLTLSNLRKLPAWPSRSGNRRARAKSDGRALPSPSAHYLRRLNGQINVARPGHL